MPVPTEVVVVGGGIVGLSTAFFLHEAGADVTVLEAGRIGAGASWGNAGLLVPAFCSPLPSPATRKVLFTSALAPDAPLRVRPWAERDMLGWLLRFRRFGTEGAFGAGREALARLGSRTMVTYGRFQAAGVAFDLRLDGVLMAFLDRRSAGEALEALVPMSRFGQPIPDRVLEGEDLWAEEPSLTRSVRAGFVVEGQGHVNPGSLLEALAGHLRAQGVTIEEDTGVTGAEVNGPRASAVATEGGTVPAGAVVVAAGWRTPGIARMLGTRVPIQPGKGHSFSVKPRTVPRRPLYFAEPRLACTPFGDRVRVAGTVEFIGADDRVDARRVEAMAGTARRHVGEWTSWGIREAWAGMRPVAPDGLPVVGRMPGLDNVFVATGHSTLGMTLGPPTGESLADMIGGGDVPEMLRPFAPERF